MMIVLIAFALLFFAVQTRLRAEAPEITAQQREYKEARTIWERRAVPRGFAGAAEFQRKERRVTLRDSGISRTAMRLHNVEFQVADGIGFYVRTLAVTLEPIDQSAPVDFDRVDSFIIRIHEGEVLMRSSALTRLFNRHVLDYQPRPLNDVTVSTSQDRIETKAGLQLHWLPGVELPSSLAGTINLTPDNKLYFKIESVSALGIPVGDVLRALNITLPSLISLQRDGVSLQDFGLLLDHRTMFPPPRFAGDIAGARLSAEGLHLSFGGDDAVAFDAPRSLGNSHIWIQSGDPKFFGAIVTNARIAIVPGQAGRVLSFDLYDYRQQLSKATGHLREDGMMTVTVP
jgi:hypothetical protein